MEALHQFSFRLAPITLAEKCFLSTSATRTLLTYRTRIFNAVNSYPKSLFNANLISRKSFSSSSSSSVAKAGWFLGIGQKNKVSLPDIVKAGDPVLHEPAQEVNPTEISSERIQKIIDDMIKVMRKAPGVGLAAPQIGIPLRVSLNFGNLIRVKLVSLTWFTFFFFLLVTLLSSGSS